MDASHDGVDAARTGPLLDGQVTWLQTTVNGPGTLSFWWNVSSEEGAAPFELYAAPGSPPSRTSCSRAAKTCGRSRCSRDRHLTVPDGVESIGDEAFADVQPHYGRQRLICSIVSGLRRPVRSTSTLSVTAQPSARRRASQSRRKSSEKRGLANPRP